MDPNEILNKATTRYYQDPKFHNAVEYGIMFGLSQKLSFGVADEIREVARVSAAIALCVFEESDAPKT